MRAKAPVGKGSTSMHTQPTLFLSPPAVQVFPRRRRARGRGGFTLMEVAMAMVVFTMMTMMFAAVFPMAVRGAQFSGNYTQGTMLAQHKMDQLRTTGYNRLIDSTQLAAMGIIDSPQPAGYPIVSNGATTYSFTSVDALTNNGATQGYFPPGSMGTVTVSDYATGAPPSGTSGVPAATLAYVTVTLSWTGGGISSGSTSVSAIISKDAQ